MKTAMRIGFVLMLLGCLLAGAAWAQEERANKPAGPAAPLYDDGKKADMPQETLLPDERPLTGAEKFTLGSSEGTRNFLLPSFRFTQTADSNPGVFSTTGTDFGGVSTVGGSLELQRRAKRHEFNLRYDGGGTFYTGQSNAFSNSRFNTSFHDFGLSGTYSFGRWTVMGANETSYTPEAIFGYGAPGFGAISNFPGAGLGNSLLGLNPNLLPNQSILTGHSSRISNSTVGQVQYSLSPRSSFTATGSYGILRFPDGQLQDSDQINVGAGYNRVLTSRDVVGVSYGYGLFRFQGTHTDLESHSLQLMYGRRVTGRLGLQVSGGAQLYGFNNLGGSRNSVSWTGGTNLTYRVRRTDLRLGYMRWVNGGAGVLLGARSDLVNGGVSRPFTKTWTGSADFGYSHNTGLRTGTDYDAQYVGLALHRRLGRYAGIYFSYNLQRQTNNVPCVGTCNDRLLRHIFGFGFDWRFRPIRLD